MRFLMIYIIKKQMSVPIKPTLAEKLDFYQRFHIDYDDLPDSVKLKITKRHAERHESETREISEHQKGCSICRSAEGIRCRYVAVISRRQIAKEVASIKKIVDDYKWRYYYCFRCCVIFCGA